MSRRAPARPRGEPVIRAVAEATLEELARVGYGALTFEEVAARAGVNKTTVYRRWPSKPDLVKAALTDFASAAPPPVETGDVRRDLFAIARRTRDLMSSRPGRGLLRMLLGGCVDASLVELALSLRREFDAPARRILDHARARGDLCEEGDPALLLAAIGGWIVHVLLREREEVDDDRLLRFVELLLDGCAGSSAAQAEARSRSTSSASGEAASTSRGSLRSAISAKSAMPSNPSTT